MLPCTHLISAGARVEVEVVQLKGFQAERTLLGFILRIGIVEHGHDDGLKEEDGYHDGWTRQLDSRMWIGLCHKS